MEQEVSGLTLSLNVSEFPKRCETEGSIKVRSWTTGKDSSPDNTELNFSFKGPRDTIRSELERLEAHFSREGNLLPPLPREIAARVRALGVEVGHEDLAIHEG